MFTTHKHLSFFKSVHLYMLIGLAIISIWSFPTHAQTFNFTPFSAKYSVKKSGISLGEAHFTLKQLDDHRWEYASYIKPKGMASWITSQRVRESSIVYVMGSDILPLSYSYQRTGGTEENAQINFNWVTKQASVTLNGKTKRHTLTGNEQDHYSLVLNLMRMAAMGTPSKKMTVINKDTKQYTYTLKGQEQVKTKVQTFNTTKITQTDTGSRQLHYWLSPEVNFMPVKIEQYQQGKKKFALILTSYEQN